MLKHIRGIEKSLSLFENLGEGWLSTKDVAKFLSLSPNAVRIMVCRGKIPAFQIGGT